MKKNKYRSIIADLTDTFTKSKSMELPRKIVVGHNAIESVGAVCRELKVPPHALIVADPTTKRIAGDRVAELLGEDGFAVELITIEGATMDDVDAVIAALLDDAADIVLGVGGGRPIDVAKVASYRKRLPFISIPTAASHDGIVSAKASISSEETKESIAVHTPIAVIGDTHIIARSPHRLLAAGCGDIISNYTAVKDWRLAHRLKNDEYSTYGAALSEMTARMLVDNAEVIKPGLEESAWLVMKALVSSGMAMCIAGSSRPASGAEHKFSHTLDRIAPQPALHGEQCAVGTIMTMYLHGGDWKAIRKAMRTIGLPTDATGLGIDEDIIIEALVNAHHIKPKRLTILGEGLTEEAAVDCALRTKVIGRN